MENLVSMDDKVMVDEGMNGRKNKDEMFSPSPVFPLQGGGTPEESGFSLGGEKPEDGETLAQGGEKSEESMEADDFGEEFGKVKYLSAEQNLNLPKVRAEMVDEDAPFSSFTMMGKWLREAADLSNYWQGMQRVGADTASYVWALREGELGAFDFKKFGGEMLKSGVRSLGQNMLSTTGNLLTMFGANLDNGAAAPVIMTSGAGAVLPQTGKLMKELGQSLRTYAEKVEDISFLASPEEAFEEKPSWSKLANTLGSGSSQVLAMGGISRLIGAKATYGLFAGGGAGEVFSDTLEQGGDVAQANTLAAVNAGATFSIDRIFDPLPEVIAKNAKVTSGKIAKEILGAPLREAGSEVLQQMLAENLVRKVGLDDTQDLFEGLLESALGAIAGSGSLMASAGTAYVADKSVNAVRRRILLKGVKKQELELYEKNMMVMIEENPQAFEKILGANLKENLRQMDLAARQIKNRSERTKTRNNLKGFEEVYNEMYARFLPALKNEDKAKAAARMFEANAISLYGHNPDFTPRKLIDGLLPNLKRMNAAEFWADKNAAEAVAFSLIGIKAKNADTNLLTQAMTMTENGADPLLIWQKTGWHLGGDGRWRMEVSDRDAYIKHWGDLDLREGVLDTLHDHKIEMERIKGYLAAGLRSTAMNGFGHFYNDFYKYLQKQYDKDAEERLNFKEETDSQMTSAQLRHLTGGDFVRPEPYKRPKPELDILEVISETDRQRREIEDVVLADWFSQYSEMVADKREPATYGEMLVELEKAKSRTYDFSEEQYNYIKGVLEQRRRREFFEKYWDKNTGVANNKEFRMLAENANFRYGDDPRYIEGLANVFHQAQQRRKARTAELDRMEMTKQPYMFEDIDKDEAYGKYRLYKEDFSPDMSHKDFYPQRYHLAYMPKTSSEEYLAQKKFKYMKDSDKRLLASYLDIEEKIFKIDKYLEAAMASYELQDFFSAGSEAEAEPVRFKNGEFNWDYIRFKRNKRAREPKRLGDILEHPVLFGNYPSLADMNVRFTRLQDDMPYHIYFNKNEGYVLEIDRLRVTKQQLKEVLLKGAAFAIQDMEGFDYSLTDAQRRNFMNRQIFLATKNLQEFALNDMREYVVHYLPRVNPEAFIKDNLVPLPLAGLTESADVDAKSLSGRTRTSFLTVDYPKLYKAVRKRYAHVAPEGENIKHLALMDLQQIQRRNASMIMAEARMNGGYSAGILPWAGVTSQGAVDARALAARMDYSEAQLKEKPFFEMNGDLKAVREEVRKGLVSKDGYVPDVMDPYDEFAKNISEDARVYRDTVEVMAKGAFDSADRTITLFETADADTIVHETFHYFWDLMEKAEYRNESHAANFHEVMGELRENFVRHYVVKEFDGKWFALHKDTGEIMEEMPRGFNSKNDVIDAGVRELFVAHFLKLLNKDAVTDSMGTITDAADFYRRWLKTVTNKLGLKWYNTSPDGRRLLAFLRYKFK